MKGILSTIKGRTQHRVVSEWVLMQSYFENDNTLMLCFADRHSNDQVVFNLEEEDVQRLRTLVTRQESQKGEKDILGFDSDTNTYHFTDKDVKLSS